MNIWNRVVLRALAGLGVTLAAHAYGPGNPPSLPSVPEGFKECAVDGGVCKVPPGATAYVVYGTNGKFLTAQGTGDFTCLPKGWVPTPSASKPQDLGIPDPVPNVQKKCYLHAAAPAEAQGKKSCYWMSNTAGNPWVPSPSPAPDEAACKRLDSCSPDGGKASGGGCYKWATAEEMNKPAPKMTCWWMDSAPPNLWKPSPSPAADQAACKRLDSCSPDGGKASGGGCYVWAAEEQVKGENARKMAAPPPPPPKPVVGFAAEFAPTNWEAGSNAPSPIVDTSKAPASVTLKNYTAWASSGSAFAYTKPHPELHVTFSYDLSGSVPGACDSGFFVGDKQTYLANGKGKQTITVPANQKFGFHVNGKNLPNDFACKVSSPVALTISEIVVTPK